MLPLIGAGSRYLEYIVSIGCCSNQALGKRSICNAGVECRSRSVEQLNTNAALLLGRELKRKLRVEDNAHEPAARIEATKHSQGGVE